MMSKVGTISSYNYKMHMFISNSIDLLNDIE
jgi:hypothetical protein